MVRKLIFEDISDKFDVRRIWVVQGTSVCMATRYELEGPGIESRCWRDFPHSFRPALVRTQPPMQWDGRSFREEIGLGELIFFIS
jgi:hypothetical protein